MIFQLYVKQVYKILNVAVKLHKTNPIFCGVVSILSEEPDSMASCLQRVLVHLKSNPVFFLFRKKDISRG
jgi:hypothetical protein